MAEENKTIELKEDELQKVTGGYTSEGDFETYSVDDCFRQSSMFIYVITQAGDSNSNKIYYDIYSEETPSLYCFKSSSNASPSDFKSWTKYIGTKSNCGYSFTGK